MKEKNLKIVMTALLAALTCIATMVIKIPSPLNGYLNLGDGIVLIAGWVLSPLGGFMAAGVGSALADIFSGYVIYAPATFLIKGLMALAAYFVFIKLSKNGKTLPARVVGGVIAEIIMILGYFVFEGFLYGFAPSVVNIPANGVQGIAGLILALLLVNVFKKSRKQR